MTLTLLDLLYALAFVVLLAAQVAVMALTWPLSPRRQKVDGVNHVHQGAERSRHEVSGQTVIVGECSQCACHFNLVLS